MSPSNLISHADVHILSYRTELPEQELDSLDDFDIDSDDTPSASAPQNQELEKDPQDSQSDTGTTSSTEVTADQSGEALS